MSKWEVAASILSDHGCDLDYILADAVAAERARITEAVRGLPTYDDGGAEWPPMNKGFNPIAGSPMVDGPCVLAIVDQQ